MRVVVQARKRVYSHSLVRAKCYERNSRSNSVMEGRRWRAGSRLRALSGTVVSWLGRSSNVAAVMGEKRTLDTEFDELSFADT